MKLLRIEEVSSMTSLSRSTIKRMVRAGEFPAPIRVGKNRVAWEKEELEAWVQERRSHAG